MKASGIKHDGGGNCAGGGRRRTWWAGETGVTDTEPTPPDPDTGPPPPPLRGDPLLDPGIHEVILNAELKDFNLRF